MVDNRELKRLIGYKVGKFNDETLTEEDITNVKDLGISGKTLDGQDLQIDLEELSDISKLIEKFGNNSKFIPNPVLVRLRRFNDHLKTKFPDPVTTNYRATLEDITTDFDDRIIDNAINSGTLKKMKLRNNSAYDELNGMNNGLLVMATIGYMIVTSNIIMPIIKHKLKSLC